MNKQEVDYREAISKWSPTDLVQFFEFSGIDAKKLEPIINENINGRKFLELKDSKKLKTLKDFNLGLIGQISNAILSYKPCVASHTEIEGLADSAGMDSEAFFKVITKDEDDATRPPIGQKLEIHVPEDDFRIEVYDNRYGEIDVSIIPLKVGPYKIEIFLDKKPIKGSPFTLVVVPPNVPIHTIQRSDLEALIEMSKGNYGRVYKGRCNNLDVAIKEMIGIKKNNVEQKMGEFLGEVNILQRLHHPNIITFLGVCIDGDAVQEWYIVLEWAERASLQKLLEKEKDLPLEVKFKICIDIARGMGWLHHRPKPIIHFDLKPANILVMNDYTCKIADFGLSIVSEMKSSSANRGTMLYMPPETLRRKWYYKAGLNSEAEAVPLVPPELLPKIDVYSFGLIMWEICTQKEVFLEYNEIEEFCSAICDKDARPKLNDTLPPQLVDIMTKCWSKGSINRPDFRELVPHLETARIKSFLDHRAEIAFWQSYFPTKPRVPFSDFVKALWRHTAKVHKKPERSCGFESSLVKLISTSANAEDLAKAEVSLESYSKLIAWFGPLNERGYFEDFCNIMQMESTWFFPNIKSGVEAEGYMSAAMKTSSKGGYFLVRLTARTVEKTPGERKDTPFTITYIDDNGIIHKRIPRTSEGYIFQVNNNVYKNESLLGLISTLMSNLPNIFTQPLVITNLRYNL